MVGEKILVTEAIIMWEAKAAEMIELLAQKLGIDLNSEQPFNRAAIKANNPLKGALSDEWTYWFHGSHCDFENQATAQYLHVDLYREGKYRTIDYYYLYKFIQTTESLNSTHKAINSEEYFRKILVELEKDGTLINILKAPPDFPSRLMILNHHKK